MPTLVKHMLRLLRISALGAIVLPMFWTQTSLAGPASDVWAACKTGRGVGSKSFSELTRLNWTEVTKFSPNTQLIIADGMLAAMSTSRSIPLNWTDAETKSQRVAAKIKNKNAANSAMRLFEHASAALVVSEKSQGTKQSLQCIFAGPQDAEISALLTGVAKMDAMSNLGQATNGLEIHNINEIENSVMVDTVIGRFSTKKLPVLNRPPHAEIGMSIIRISQK